MSGGTKGLGYEFARQASAMVLPMPTYEQQLKLLTRVPRVPSKIMVQSQAILKGSACAVLSSRSPRLSKDKLMLLVGSGASVFMVSADASSAMEGATVLHWVYEQLPALGTFVHAAGTIEHDILKDVTEDAFQRVCRSKV